MLTVEERAADRRSWSIRRFVLGGEPEDDLLAVTSALERLAMLAELSEQAWALAGPVPPRGARSAMPGRVVRPGR